MGIKSDTQEPQAAQASSRIRVIGAPITPERLSVYLAAKSWNSYWGALLVCGIDPCSLASSPAELRAVLEDPLNTRWLREDAADDIERYGVVDGLKQARKTMGLWRTTDLAPEHIPPRVFLMWCKFRRIKDIDDFLKRAEQVYPPMFKNPEIFATVKAMREACPDYLRSIFDDGSGSLNDIVPTSEVGSVGTATLAKSLVADNPGGLKKRERQIQAIEAGADVLQFDRKKIPDSGKKAIRAWCKENHADLFGVAESSFDDAWKAARKSDRVAMAHLDKFAGRK